VTILSSTFTGNTASAGTDLYNLDSTVTIIASQISGIGSNGGTVTDPFADLIAQVTALNLNQGEKNSLTSKLQAASQSLMRTDDSAATHQLDAFINQLNALVNSHRLGAIAADSVIDEVDDLLGVLS
jgi:hypothetical protein